MVVRWAVRVRRCVGLSRCLSVAFAVYGEVHASLLKLLDGTKTPRLLEAADAATADLAKTLRASPEAVELAMGTSALLSQTVAQLMHALRLFSFG